MFIWMEFSIFRLAHARDEQSMRVLMFRRRRRHSHCTIASLHVSDACNVRLDSLSRFCIQVKNDLFARSFFEIFPCLRRFGLNECCLFIIIIIVVVIIIFIMLECGCVVLWFVGQYWQRKRWTPRHWPSQHKHITTTTTHGHCSDWCWDHPQLRP